MMLNKVWTITLVGVDHDGHTYEVSRSLTDTEVEECVVPLLEGALIDHLDQLLTQQYHTTKGT